MPVKAPTFTTLEIPGVASVVEALKVEQASELDATLKDKLVRHLLNVKIFKRKLQHVNENFFMECQKQKDQDITSLNDTILIHLRKSSLVTIQKKPSQAIENGKSFIVGCKITKTRYDYATKTVNEECIVERGVGKVLSFDAQNLIAKLEMTEENENYKQCFGSEETKTISVQSTLLFNIKESETHGSFDYNTISMQRPGLTPQKPKDAIVAEEPTTSPKPKTNDNEEEPTTPKPKAKDEEDSITSPPKPKAKEYEEEPTTPPKPKAKEDEFVDTSLVTLLTEDYVSNSSCI